MLDEVLVGHDDDSGPVLLVRRRFLIDLRSMVQEHGLPLPDERQLDACVMPFIFQELNYDDYDWSSRTAPLGGLVLTCESKAFNCKMSVWQDRQR